MISKIDNTTAIIVTYNSGKVIDRCLDGLINIKKIIVDNSKDLNLKKHLKEKYKNITIIHPNHNIGFGSANNLGISTAETKYILLLNPDIIFNERQIDNLIKIFDLYENVGIVAPKVYDHNNQYLDNHCYSALKKTKRSNNLNNIHNIIKKTEPNGNLCADVVTGAIFLSKKEILNKIGLFDQNIFLYYEDQDLCKRLRDKKYQIIECANSYAKHPNNDINRSVILNNLTNFNQSKHHKYSEYYFKSKYSSKSILIFQSLIEFFEYFLRMLLNFFLFKKNKIIINFVRCIGILKFIFKF